MIFVLVMSGSTESSSLHSRTLGHLSRYRNILVITSDISASNRQIATTIHISIQTVGHGWGSGQRGAGKQGRLIKWSQSSLGPAVGRLNLQLCYGGSLPNASPLYTSHVCRGSRWVVLKQWDMGLSVNTYNIHRSIYSDVINIYMHNICVFRRI